MDTRVIVYDTEIKRLIPERGKPRDPNYEYCEGWTDFEGMGIACICAVDVDSGISRAFLGDNLRRFADWTAGAILVGHSNDQFDDQLLKAHSLYTAAASWDIIRKLRKAVGEPEGYTRGVTKAGRTVNDLARANLRGLTKSDDGANAPLLFQRGAIGELVDYCLRDVALEYQLFLRRGAFVDPVTGRILVLEEPALPAAA